jgi:hypothetical protein
MGFRFQNQATGNSRRVVNLITATPDVNLCLRINAADHFEVLRGDATSLATGTATIASSTWYYVEFYALISDTVGKIQVRVNQVDDIALTTGLDTRQDATGAGTVITGIGIIPDSSSHYVDDLWVNDTTGAQNTGFSGDIRVAAYIPNAAGDVTGLTPTGGANYTNVDERPPNDATDIVSATGTTLYDLYHVPNTSGVGTVQAVTLWLRAQKSDAGAKSIAHKLKSASTEDTGADLTLSTTWAYYGKVYNVDPTDSVAWTAGKVDALQIGAKAR